ncbi:protein of unknown function DUF255 [Dethiosulfovibrio peptidovorans DSM 11002]|uniref:Spermatogenesis-associated protein 20-like TRX domain-containing protein n=1 Tax=Dethiosulfovibrio peptidovorans DSM 11002 TaxID=469381 RepID=D2Z813_9BACT|nr:DUF255 domain-containing protein [Dethiosulfovibrio peptidovorans]EFC91610.1 protein of unknown function DUF255 [Dethiosulfovibrio peptidovorans DSM 11002]
MFGSGHDDLIRWSSWGEKAVRRSKEEHKPLFLYIGSPTCRLCNIEYRESFANDEVAKLLNEDFVPVRMDRESFPILSDCAMSVNRIMNGSGGWPLNLFLTPDLKPFFVSSYMPLRGTPDRPGFLDCLPRIKWLWLTENEALVRASEEVLESLKKSTVTGTSDIPESTLKAASEELLNDLDELWGGFGQGGKFTSVQELLFLSEYDRRTGCKRCDEALRLSLDGMSMGAIRDHLGGGFHSCSLDREWRRPRFEKLLVDQAMAAMAFAEGFDRYGKVFHWRVADETLAYALLNLYSPGKGFLASQSYETEDGDMDYYLWTSDEIDSALGEDAGLFKRAYGITDEGNYIEETTGSPSGKNVLFLTAPLDRLAEDEGMEDEQDLEDLLAKGRQVLSSLRRERQEPEKNGRILSDWNGFFIAALARCGRVMERRNYVALAERECSRIWSEGELFHTGDIPATLDDYAAVIWAFLETYRSTDNMVWKERAKKFLARCEELFGLEGRGYRLSENVGEGILFSRSHGRDGLYPSGNAVMANNLVTLWECTEEKSYRDRAVEVISSFGDGVKRVPGGYSHLLTALSRVLP